MINTYEQVYRLWVALGFIEEGQFMRPPSAWWAEGFRPYIPEEEIKAERGEER